METVKAPDGYEGQMYFDDGARSYKVGYRRVGDTWWTLCYLDAGGVHHTRDERHARAEQAIIHAIKIGGRR